MVGGSGHPRRQRRGCLAESGRPRRPIGRAIPLILLAVGSGCVYFNALYNANRLFDRGRKAVEEAGPAAGRSVLGESIEKAERIVAEQPDSKWADDAQRIVTRARLLREEWEEAAAAARRLLELSQNGEDSAQAAGYLGRAELELGRPAAADSLLTVALGSAEGDRERARLLLHRGRARTRLGRLGSADADLRAASELRDEWLEPRMQRVRTLLAADRGEEAADEFARILERVRPGRAEEEVVEVAGLIAERDRRAAVTALGELESADLSRDAAARLFVFSGDVRRSLEEWDDAVSAYRAAIRRAPDSRAAVDAYRAQAEIVLQGADGPADLDRAFELLQRGSRIPVGRRVVDVYELMDAVRRVRFWVDHGGLGLLAAAETVRDQFGAPRLARDLFLEYARQQPDDLWTAKAILAAIELTPPGSTEGPSGNAAGPGREDLRRRLLEEYQSSPYVQVLLGGASDGVPAEPTAFSYEELEEGLSRQLERLYRLAEQELDPTRQRRGGS